ncbi:TPA: transferrin-binding protein-like solute binding protein [Neisseria meningitidis]|nr:transferrin-binding protein-like solute binding protein [Neisseria meningitidis]
MTIPFKPSLLAMASVLALSACISGGGDAPAVKSSETPSNKVAPPPADTASPATGADTASPSAGGDGGDSKTEMPPKDTRGEDAPAGTDGGVQNDASQHNDNAPVNGISDTQPENNRDMPDSDAGKADGGNQDIDAPKNAESLDGTEGNAVSEGTGMPANPPSGNAEHTEVATNVEGTNPPSEAENSEGAGQGGMQADEADGRQDAEEGLQGDDSQAVPPAEDGLKTGSLGEKYFDGKGAITALMIGGETIDLTKADDRVSSNHLGLLSNWDTVMVSKGQYQHLIYGATKLKDGTYTLFVQGNPTETLPTGTAKYKGNVLHFVGKYKDDWLNNSAYKAAGTFTANVDFSRKTLTGKIDTKDPSGMGMQEFTANFDGNGFKGKWKSDNDKGDISGGFYGEDGAEMAGRYSYKDNDERKSGFGVFAGKKEASAR